MTPGAAARREPAATLPLPRPGTTRHPKGVPLTATARPWFAAFAACAFDGLAFCPAKGFDPWWSVRLVPRPTPWTCRFGRHVAAQGAACPGARLDPEIIYLLSRNKEGCTKGWAAFPTHLAHFFLALYREQAREASDLSKLTFLKVRLLAAARWRRGPTSGEFPGPLGVFLLHAGEMRNEPDRPTLGFFAARQSPRRRPKMPDENRPTYRSSRTSISSASNCKERLVGRECERSSA